MKRTLFLVLAFVLLLSFSACTGEATKENTSATIEEDTPKTTEEATTALAEEAELDGGVTNASGLPIVNEEITLKIATWYYSGSIYLDEKTVTTTLSEETGINFEFIHYTEKEKVQLMYASKDYPDISWRVDGGDSAKLDAIEAGDVVRLDDYLQYAPNIVNMFEKFPSVKRQVTYTDGSVYSFPYFENDSSMTALRDTVVINRVWLDELGLEIPKTLDELLTVLRSTRDAAGTGTIPEEVIPYYMYYPTAIGSIFDFVCWFGTYVFDANWNAVIDETFNFQAVNEDIIEPIQYLNLMYKEGLVNQNMFTDGWTEYFNNFLSDPPQSMIVAGYYNQDDRNYALDGYYYPLSPIDTGNGKKPMVRTQASGASRPTNFMIYNVNEYPVASVRLADYMCDPTVAVSMRYGVEGIAWEYVDGVATKITSFDAADDPENHGLDNLGFVMIDVDATVVDPAEFVEGSRLWAIKNVFSDYLTYYTFPKLPYSVKLEDIKSDRLSDLHSELFACFNNYFSRWVIGEGDVAEEWDAYIAEMKAIGVDEYIQLQQEKLDIAYSLGD